MKKLALMMAVVLMSIGCMAQKANVSKAKSLSAQYENPDFDQARRLIKAALEDETTKDLTNTWFVAGLIGYNEYQYYWTQAQFGQSYDEMKLNAAVEESFDYWLVADKMSQVPNEKGKVDAKTRNNINQKVLDYFQHYILANYSLAFNEQQDYERAYELMKKHFSIPSLDMMQTEKLQKGILRDSTYYTYFYYMGRFAYQAKHFDEALDIFRQMEQEDVRAIARQSDVMYSLEYLALCQLEMKDTVSYIQTMKQGIERYPSEEWFTVNLINHYIFNNQYDEAVEYLEQVIAANPTAVPYYFALGDIHERQEKLDEALADYEKVLSIDANNANAWAGKGRCIYNQAVKLNEQAADIQDAKEYNLKLKEMNAKFAESLPFFEKAHELNKEDRSVMITLKGIYYRLKMNDKYEAINNEINGD